MRHHFLWLTGVALALAPASQARFAPAPSVPVDRLIKNVQAHIQAHPRDVHARYTLARIHHMAYVTKRDHLGSWARNDGLPSLAGFTRHGADVKTLDAAAARAHLRAAITGYETALAMDGTRGLTWLGLASALEQGAGDAGRLGVLYDRAALPAAPDDRWATQIAALGDADFARRKAAARALSQQLAQAVGALDRARAHADPEIRSRVAALLARHWRRQALAANHAAYTRAIKADLALPRQPIRGLRSLVAFESGQAYLKLAATLGGEPDARVQAVKDGIAQLQKKPRGPITPIVFGLDRARPLAELLSPQTQVRFDLDGDGTAERRPWVARHTAILVWDPTGSGLVASGRQLFGSVTWWLFWTDGYAALRALDDDGDGWLRGRELTGLAVWVDRNGNGRSEPGEVRPLSVAGVRGLATRARGTAADGRSLANPVGLELADGRRLPTYDWVLGGR